MFKLLVDLESGEQVTVEVGENGFFSEPNRVIWDERKDGELSAETLALVGSLVRVGNSLKADNDRRAQHDAALAIRAQAESDQALTLAQELMTMPGAQGAINRTLLHMLQDAYEKLATAHNNLGLALVANLPNGALKTAIQNLGLEPIPTNRQLRQLYDQKLPANVTDQDSAV